MDNPLVRMAGLERSCCTLNILILQHFYAPFAFSFAFFVS